MGRRVVSSSMAAGQSGPCVRQGDLVSPVAEFLFGRKDRYGGNKLLPGGTQTFTADDPVAQAFLGFKLVIYRWVQGVLHLVDYTTKTPTNVNA